MGKKIMKIKLFVWVGCVLLFMTTFCFANENSTLRTQGLINPGGNPKAGYLLINEMKIYIDQKTQLMDIHKGSIPLSEFRPKRWVYLEIEKDPNEKKFIARKIYLLPHYVNPKEKGRFSFMK